MKLDVNSVNKFVWKQLHKIFEGDTLQKIVWLRLLFIVRYHTFWLRRKWCAFDFLGQTIFSFVARQEAGFVWASSSDGVRLSDHYGLRRSCACPAWSGELRPQLHDSLLLRWVFCISAGTQLLNTVGFEPDRVNMTGRYRVAVVMLDHTNRKCGKIPLTQNSHVRSVMRHNRHPRCLDPPIAAWI